MKMNELVFEAGKANQGCDSWSLYFDKFSGYDRKKEDILKKVIEFYNKPVSKEFLNKKLAQKYSFFAKLAEKDNVKLLFFENRSRLLVNMGHSLVLENVGFSFERISGLPYIPGSALKGVTSNWSIWDANGDAAFAENLQGFKTKRSLLENDLVDIFGGNDGDEVQGKINFYGIFPMTLPELEIDIITPHGNRIIPNHFLTVAAGSIWFVPISYNRGEYDSKLLEKTEKLIEECLINYGVGAKTASGYGKFDVVSLDNKKYLNAKNRFGNSLKIENEKADKLKKEQEIIAKEKERINNLSPEQLAMEEFENSLAGLTIKEKAGDLKGRMAKIADCDEAEQKSICLLLADKYSEFWIEDLADAKKAETQNEKKKKKNKGLKRVNAVKTVAEKLEIKL